MDYLSKNSFSSFLNELHQSFSIVFAMLEDAYQRDANLTHNLLDSHFSSNGHLTVKKETHEYLERFKKEIILEKRFLRPECMPYQEDKHYNPVIRTFESCKNEASTYQYRVADSQYTARGSNYVSTSRGSK
jgi:hypothetical protein